MKMKTSLVLSSYNGSRYIAEQLDSILLQTRPPDTVYIRDDCSTDGTSNIVEQYIHSHSLANWSVAINAVNQGWKKNFHELIASADGDLIFLCDQDDLWLPNKIEDMAAVMESHDEIDVLACSVEPFYETGSQKVSGEEGMKGTSSGNVRYQDVDSKSIYVLRPGCSYCIRNSFAKQIEPYWNDEWAHDAVLWILSEVKGTLALYDKTLVRFRRHEGNASAREKMTQQRRIEDLAHLIERIDTMEMFAKDYGYLTPEKSAALEDMRSWLTARIRFLNNADFSSFLETVAGRKHYPTSRGLPADIALALFSKLAI